MAARARLHVYHEACAHAQGSFISAVHGSGCWDPLEGRKRLLFLVVGQPSAPSLCLKFTACPKGGGTSPPPSCCVCAQACLLQPWDQSRGASCREGGTTLAKGQLSPPGLGPPLLVHCSCTRNTVALQACPTRHQCVSCCPADSWGTGAATPSTPDSAGVGLNCTGKCSPSAPPSEVGSGSTGSTGSAGHPAPQCWRTPHEAGIGENLFANGVRG